MGTRNPLCLAGLHAWRLRKWGKTPRMAAWLDGRECKRCGRWEVYHLGSYEQRDRANFPELDQKG